MNGGEGDEVLVGRVVLDLLLEIRLVLEVVGMELLLLQRRATFGWM